MASAILETVVAAVRTTQSVRFGVAHLQWLSIQVGLFLCLLLCQYAEVGEVGGRCAFMPRGSVTREVGRQEI